MASEKEHKLKNHYDQRFFRTLGQHLWRHFKRDRLFQVAGALSYTSLLAIVPLLAVGLGIISSFEVFQDWSGNLQDFIFRNFVPSVGEEVKTYIQVFMASTSKLTIIGTLFLIVTALALMSAIENAFNRIWRVTSERTFLSKMVMFWAVLTLAPLLMGAALALTARQSLTGFDLAFANSIWFETLAIFLFTWGALTLIFILIPNRQVNWRHAVIGGLISTILFQLAKKGFVVYVSGANYKTVYDSMATIPIFLFWIYISWVVVLFGASLTAALTTFRYRRSEWQWPRHLELQLLFRLLADLLQAQKKGIALSLEDILIDEPSAADSQILAMLGDLQQSGLVMQSEQNGWLLSRNLDEVSFESLLKVGDYSLPLGWIAELPETEDIDRRFKALMTELYSGSESALKRTLQTSLQADQPFPLESK
ncbi:MAG: YihY family inner membrane protein [Xanthomonadales bacterium]|nr:YihY family inner membrane protein [Xanthomonadales bacterium]